jgi:GNAT superfamily N-acetyltransferase
MDIVLREAGLEDASLLVHLTRSCWADKVAPNSTGHQESIARVEDDLMRGGAFILFVNEEPAGSVRWLPLDDDTHVWEMRRMGVLPAFRGHALSQHLLEAVIHHALASGIEELRLGVRADQPRLVDLYSAYQFELAPEVDYSQIASIETSLEAPPNVMRRYL